MNIKDYQDGKIITLSTAFDTRGKFLYIIYFAFFSFAGVGFLNMAGSFNNYSTGLVIIVTIAVAAYLFAGYRFLNKALETEKLIIEKNGLTISRSGFLSKQRHVYDINLISNLRYLNKPEITKHPLAGQSFDSLGFQTEQQVINEMHGDNKIAFDYNSRVIKFGENIYSWDFEQIEGLVLEITGRDFRYERMNKKKIIQDE